MVKAGLDAFVIGVVLPKRANLGEVSARLFGALREAGVKIDPWPHTHEERSSRQCARCTPSSVASSLASAQRRLEKNGFLDRVFRSRIWAEWQPVANWLTEIGRILEHAEGQWHELLPFLPGGVVAKSRGGVGFVFGLRPEFKDNGAIMLLVDWRTFNRAEKGPAEVSALVGLLCARTGALGAAGGPAGMWKEGLSQGHSAPFKSGAVFVSSREGVSGFTENLSRTSGAISGWRHATDAEVVSPSADGAEIDISSNLFAASWTGCSGRFLEGANGQNEAEAHFQKHVREQREWAPDQMPDLVAYVKSASGLLDSVDDAFEFWQPANHAIVKYDPVQDALSIGDLQSGDIRTCFRPGGAGYVLRKLRTGRWTPPPILGSVLPGAIQDDDELAALFSELERSVAEASAEAHAAASSQGTANVLAAVSSHERTSFLLWCARSRYLMSPDEARLDAIELEFAEASAALDVVLEVSQGNALSAAVGAAVDSYLRMAPLDLAANNPEAIADLLILRDRIEFVRMASRARGPQLKLVLPSVFRRSELEATDRLVSRSVTIQDARLVFDWWPETFKWRQPARMPQHN